MRSVITRHAANFTRLREFLAPKDHLVNTSAALSTARNTFCTSSLVVACIFEFDRAC
jgi:hypothetical protein